MTQSNPANSISPIVSYAYGLFKAHTLAHEMDVLTEASKLPSENMDGEAVGLLPQRINEAFMSRKDLSIGFFKWILNSREFTNYTYDLLDDSKRFLTYFVSIITNLDFTTVQNYISEIENNQFLKQHVKNIVDQNLKNRADNVVRFGRRLGWYALARAKKPQVIVETGLDKGLGACVLVEAIKKNKEEGFPGRYIGLDIDRGAGILFQGSFREHGEIIYGDSITTLTSLDTRIDMLVVDSCHEEGYEEKEYNAAMNKFTEHTFIISDADYGALSRHALKHNKKFLFWPEWPKDHFYPGAGIAIAF